MSTSTIPDHTIRKDNTAAKSFFHWQTVSFYVLALILLALGVWMRLHDLNVPFDRDSYDEGVYWQSLRAMSAGHTLYQQIFYSQPPFFLLSVFPIYQFFGQTIWAARLGIIIISLSGLVGAFLLGKALGGRLGAIAALLLLLLNPQFLSGSQILQADAPSLALGILAVGLAYLWWKKPEAGSIYAALTALTLALGILAKFFAVVELVPIGLLMLAQLWHIFSQRENAPNRLALLRPLLVGIAVFIITCLLIILPFAGSFSQMWHQAVSFHTDASKVMAYSRSGNKGMIENFLLSSPLTYAAGLGTVIALWRRDWRVLPLLAWFLATGFMLWRYAPLFVHHLLVLIPPMIALAVIGISTLPFKEALTQKRLSARLTAGFSVLSLIAILIVSALYAQADSSYYRAIQAQAASQSTKAPLEVAKELQRVLQPGQLVITDAQFLVSLADRNTPPALVDTSNVRIQSGYVTTQQLIEQAQQPQVRAVLFYTGRLASQTAFHTWVSQHFHLIQNYGGGSELWLKN